MPNVPSPNILALGWMDTAMALEEENRELRRRFTVLLFWVAEQEHYRTLISEEVARRYPEEAA